MAKDSSGRPQRCWLSLRTRARSRSCAIRTSRWRMTNVLFADRLSSRSCAPEGGACKYAGPATVAYGAVGAFTYRLVSTGSTPCTNSASGTDPIPGVVKACYLQ
jgi:hypothetical protein